MPFLGIKNRQNRQKNKENGQIEKRGHLYLICLNFLDQGCFGNICIKPPGNDYQAQENFKTIQFIFGHYFINGCHFPLALQRYFDIKRR